ncbi:MAG TPA: septum formation family protein [Candidatus Limnocylindrales bacterium]|nr:septum formation family protein [Candidatus Limnocylindrales bacterium]
MRIGIIAAIAGGAWVFRDYISGNATDLVVGDCFDAPTTAVDETVEDVSHHPCTDAHTAEVFFVADHPASGAYPGEDAFDAFTQENCPVAFNTYTGMDWYAETGPAVDYDIGLLYPLEEGWGRGDHEITCYIVRVDDGPMTSSLKKK